MSARGWSRLRRAAALGARHQEAVSGSRQWRALVHEAHRRADIAGGRRSMRFAMGLVERRREAALLDRLEQDL